MNKKGKKSNKSMYMIFVAIAIVVVIVIAIVMLSNNKTNNQGNTNSQMSAAEQQQVDNGDKLSQIQEKINAGQKVIDDLNTKQAALMAERTQLEKQLEELKAPKTVTATEEPTQDNQAPEEPTELMEMPEEAPENIAE